MSLDRFLFRVFHSKDYNCAHFAREVWESLTGENIDKKLGTMLTEAAKSRHFTTNLRREFKRLPAAVDPCLVIMRRPRSAPHIGVYVRGKVIHITELGVHYQPVHMAARCFNSVEYFK